MDACRHGAPRPQERGTKACEAGRSLNILITLFFKKREGATSPTELRGVGGADEQIKKI